MTGIADRESAGGCEEGGDNGGGEGSCFGHFRELLIEQADELRLIETVDEAAHESAEVGGGGSDFAPVTRYIREKNARDATGGTT